MFKEIVERYCQDKCDAWVRKCERYARLDALDRLLDGTFYDHLRFSFYDETEHPSGAYIPIKNRRPATQYRIPRMVGRQIGRKLFAGRHAPRIRHKEEAVAKDFRKLIRNCKLFKVLSDVVLMGQVGSVAATFRVDDDGDGEQRVSFSLWRAKFCEPQFDMSNELAALRVQYTTLGRDIKTMKGAPAGIEDNVYYWFIRDYTPDAETTYLPPRKSDWNPIDGFADERLTLQVWEAETTEHGLGFVPGHWFTNLAGGCMPDGAATFADAIPNLIELDYTMSQLGRGVRYSAAPQTVIIGEMIGEGRTGDPSTVIQLRAGRKDEEGTEMASDAKMLEMTGTGTEAGLKFVETLRNLALEQICASRKDPEKMKGPLSGRAMEYLDEEFADLIMDSRTLYGDNGMIPLLHKIGRALKMQGDLGSLALRWPRLFQPTAMELSQVIPALAIAVNPFAYKPGPGRPGGDGDGAGPGTPAVPVPTEAEQLIPLKMAADWLRMQMDLDLIDDEGDIPEDHDLIEPDTPEPAHGPAPRLGPPDPSDDPEAAAAVEGGTAAAVAQSGGGGRVGSPYDLNI